MTKEEIQKIEARINELNKERQVIQTEYCRLAQARLEIEQANAKITCRIDELRKLLKENKE